MDNMSIQPVEFDMHLLRRVLASSKILDSQKLQFIKKNECEIKSVMRNQFGVAEFNKLMENRPLLVNRPIINLITKREDKMILAHELNVLPRDVDKIVQDISESLGDSRKLSSYSANEVQGIKTYVYRHGSRSQVVSFLNFEMLKSHDIAKTLHKTLEYGDNTLANYFILPKHRMGNKTFIDMYKVISDNLTLAEQEGKINKDDVIRLSEWSLTQLYKLQHNSKFINIIRKDLI